MGGGGGGASSKLKKAAWKMVVAACGSFSTGKPPSSAAPSSSFSTSTSSSSVSPSVNIWVSTSMSPRKPKKNNSKETETEETESDLINDNNNNVASKNLCAICLDPLNYSMGNGSGQAIFTAQCFHAFHFSCISSNVRHGSVTCPICRAPWTQLPRNLNPPCSLSCKQSDPIFQILDDSIANFRVHRRSFLRSARYDDDDPIEPDYSPDHPRLDFYLVPIPPTLFHHARTQHLSLQAAGCSSLYHYHQRLTGPSSYMSTSTSRRPSAAAYLTVKLTHQPAIDLVLVASPNGPHLRLLKQSMALVVFSLRPVDRLAIVTYSSAAARVFPLRRMTSYGKRTALQVIDRLFYMGQADPIEGLKKGAKVLEDRTYQNSESCILHLSDCPTRSYHPSDVQVPIPIHRFNVGFGFGTSNGFVVHEFEQFLAGLLGGMIRDVQLRIGDEARIVRLGELRGGEERRMLLDLAGSEHVRVGYSYVEGALGCDDCSRSGEIIVRLEDKRECLNANREANAGSDLSIIGGRTSSVESWDYHDRHMAWRWAKHLHGYRL